MLADGTNQLVSDITAEAQVHQALQSEKDLAWQEAESGDSAGALATDSRIADLSKQEQDLAARVMADQQVLDNVYRDRRLVESDNPPG